MRIVCLRAGRRPLTERCGPFISPPRLKNRLRAKISSSAQPLPRVSHPCQKFVDPAKRRIQLSLVRALDRTSGPSGTSRPHRLDRVTTVEMEITDKDFPWQREALLDSWSTVCSWRFFPALTEESHIHTVNVHSQGTNTRAAVSILGEL